MSEWQKIGEPLGRGGQGTVFLARSPKRTQQRIEDERAVLAGNPWGIFTQEERHENFERVARHLWDYIRPEKNSELGALKLFEIPNDDPAEAREALKRLRNEI